MDVESLDIIVVILRNLAVVMPLIKSIYGSHWQEVLKDMSDAWNTEGPMSDEALPLVHASLNLFRSLKGTLGDEGNDDLNDAWKDARPLLFKGLLALLRRSSGWL